MYYASDLVGSSGPLSETISNVNFHLHYTAVVYASFSIDFWNGLP